MGGPLRIGAAASAMIKDLAILPRERERREGGIIPDDLTASFAPTAVLLKDRFAAAQRRACKARP